MNFANFAAEEDRSRETEGPPLVSKVVRVIASGGTDEDDITVDPARGVTFDKATGGGVDESDSIAAAGIAVGGGGFSNSGNSGSEFFG